MTVPSLQESILGIKAPITQAVSPMAGPLGKLVEQTARDLREEPQPRVNPPLTAPEGAGPAGKEVQQIIHNHYDQRSMHINSGFFQGPSLSDALEMYEQTQAGGLH
jgi:hypothetical protein